MKKALEKQPTTKPPVFSSESEEAQWWYENRDKDAEELLSAIDRSEAKILTKQVLEQRIERSKKSTRGTTSSEKQEGSSTQRNARRARKSQ